ncbi:proto-oncogene Mas-like [Heliangelus exortis]|uniref:proto-oncogene Mas-like n=1 Tax=Heliangelus exortis TaxID=472823 RepID=UPI003A905C92
MGHVRGCCQRCNEIGRGLYRPQDVISGEISAPQARRTRTKQSRVSPAAITRPFLLESLEAPCAGSPAAALFPGAAGGGGGRGRRRPPRAGPFTMEETNTTDLSLNNMTAGSVEHEIIDIQPLCTPDYSVLITSVVSIAISLCGIVGNMVVIWFLGFHMKRNPFTVYVLNLAVADFSLLLVLLVDLLVYVISEWSCYFSFKHTVADYVLMDLFLFCYSASMYLLVAMSTERCLSVLFPIWYRCHRPKHLSGITCGVLWALAAFLISLEFISCYASYVPNCSQVLRGLSILNFVILSSFPLLSNISLFIKLRCGSKRRHPGRLYVAVLLSLIFVIVLGLPFNVVLYLDPFYYEHFAFHVSCLLSSLNSTINPFIYFLVGSCRQCRFQGSLVLALRRVFEDKTASEEGRPVSGEPVGQTSL